MIFGNFEELGGLCQKNENKLENQFQVKLSNLDNLDNLTEKWPKNGHSCNQRVDFDTCVLSHCRISLYQAQY